MGTDEDDRKAKNATVALDELDNDSSSDTLNADDKVLHDMGYKPSFRREFTNLSTVSVPESDTYEAHSHMVLKISFAFSIMGLCSSVAVTFNTPLLIGGPASVTWCWLLGSCMSLTLGASISEIVSAFPTCGGM